jgi:hypothetical protein
MAQRTNTYAIRLAVEGGGQVKAELVSVGQSGEQSLKRIEGAGERASGGLKGLGRQAELLHTGIRILGGALAGVATVGGLTALVDHSISAANAIGKTADTIGVGVEALQELRFAAKASGVEQQTLDMALQRFTRRAAEAAQGTGEAKDALAQMGIALRDQSGNLRSSEDLLADVADAFARIEDPAERVRLAFKLFDSEGVALVNLLRGGSDALDEMRDRARDLGIVLDEALVRDAERARTELDTLSQRRQLRLHRVVRLDRERHHLVDARRDLAARAPRAVRGRLLARQQHGGPDQHQRPVRDLPLGLGLLDQPGLQRRLRPHRVLRRVVDPRHGTALARRSVRLPAPMERSACAHGQPPPATPPQPAPAWSSS